MKSKIELVEVTDESMPKMEMAILGHIKDQNLLVAEVRGRGLHIFSGFDMTQRGEEITEKVGQKTIKGRPIKYDRVYRVQVTDTDKWD